MGDFFQVLRPATQDPTKFQTLRPASPVVKLASVIVLPPFSFTGLTWKGASQLLAQYNLTLTGNWTIPILPSGSGKNYCLCVRFRVGTAPYRYKLWSGVGEVLYVPQYVSQVLKSNFTLEVWSTTASTATNPSTLSIVTSQLVVPDNALSVGPIIAGTGVQRIPQQFGVINPAANPNILDYLADNI